jgi:hypothetical protein
LLLFNLSYLQGLLGGRPTRFHVPEAPNTVSDEIQSSTGTQKFEITDIAQNMMHGRSAMRELGDDETTRQHDDGGKAVLA